MSSLFEAGKEVDAFPIVGVASSAGDLEAICELLCSLPADCGTTLIIVQHLESRRESLLMHTLAEKTVLPVRQARDGLVVEPEHVYLTAVNATLTMTAGRICVIPNAGGLHHSGDSLLTSLAEERGRSAIGVVLSGEGFDGTLGVQAIRRGGGATLAQYPGSARFPSMPISAIETRCVDFVLRPNEIARELARLSRGIAPATGVAGHGLTVEDHQVPSRGSTIASRDSIAP